MLRTELIVEKNLIDDPSYICYKQSMRSDESVQTPAKAP
jgi:hypothetical protein